MKISDRFDQFSDGRALLIVLGMRQAKLYSGFEGEIVHITDIGAEEAEHSGREGHVAASGHSQTYTIAYDEHRDDLAHKELLENLQEKLVSLQKETPFERVLLYVPAQSKNDIIKYVPVPLKEKLEIVAEGNYLKHPPTELLELLENKRNDH